MVLPSDHVAYFECTLVVRNMLTSGAFKVWSIEDVYYKQLAFTSKTSVSADPAITRKDFGFKIELSVTGNFTLEIPTGYAEGETIEIIINQDATGRTIGAGSGWKSVGGSWVSSTANAINKITATYQGSSEWYTTIDNNITTPV